MFHKTEKTYNSKKHQIRAVFSPELPDIPVIFENDYLGGFIKHPERFPVNVKRLNFWERLKIDDTNHTDIGFSFTSKQRQKPGNIIEISILSNNEINIFLGKVVLVIENNEGYEIGILLLNEEDGPRLRIIEQVCHIELYLSDKRYKEGPFLSKERLTKEWINRFASGFPVR